MYDSVAGRFVNRDPIGFEGSKWNLMHYCDGKPLNSVDPDGQDFILTTYNYLIRIYSGRDPKEWIRTLAPGPNWGNKRPRCPEDDLRPECVDLYRHNQLQCGQLWSNCYTQDCAPLWGESRRNECQKECDRAEACCKLSGNFQLSKCEGTAPRTKEGEAEHKRLGCKNEFGEPIPQVPNQPYVTQGQF